MRFHLHFGVLLALAVVPIMSAQDGGDPFAVYRQAIENRLSAMAERAHPQMAAESAPIQSAQPPITSNAAETTTFAQRFWGGREADFAAALDRLERLRPALESILESEGVPRELAAVVLVESGARPLAISPRQARGLWQFIPETARRYGLTVGSGKDERIELESATRAAARYLRDLHAYFGDWPLALAAYNAGQKTVAGALAKARATTFWQLSSAGLLPRETRSYVPAVLGAMQLLSGSKPEVPAVRKSQRDAWVYATADGGAAQ